MNEPSNIYYLNMDRSPERKEHFLNECKRENVPENKIERFSALDGNLYNFSEYEYSLFKNYFDPRCKNMKYLMGNQLSHYYILKDIIKNEYPVCVVFQDDSILRKNFYKDLKKVIKNMPQDSEMINVGFHKYAVFKDFIPWDMTRTDDFKYISQTLLNEHICKLKPEINPCSLCYYSTRC